MLNERFRSSKKRQHFANDFNVFPLFRGADVVNGTFLAFAQNQINRAAVVFYKDPISNLLTVTINGNAFSLDGIRDDKRQEFLWKLKRPKIVSATGDQDGLPVRPVTRQR